jgi:hypothetical protein
MYTFIYTTEAEIENHESLRAYLSKINDVTILPAESDPDFGLIKKDLIIRAMVKELENTPLDVLIKRYVTEKPHSLKGFTELTVSI